MYKDYKTWREVKHQESIESMMCEKPNQSVQQTYYNILSQLSFYIKRLAPATTWLTVVRLTI